MCFTAVSIEVILNQNCQWGVLGGTADNGNILTPGQLLPTIIGAFSFIRVVYLAFEKWRDPTGDTSPSLGRQKSRRYVQAKRDSRHGFNALKMFSLSNAVDAENYRPIEDHSAGKELSQFQHLNFFLRMIITIVPHISLFWSWPWVHRDDPWSGEPPRRKDTDDSELLGKKGRTVTWDKEISVQLGDKDMYDEPVEYRRHTPKDFA